ncbi:hypothetical protein HDV02_000920 [Globomyces sp. JEL0801]|nr:hypothetical protein HDV02_000920 [Globomyces sp. JEL0801]
MVVYGLKNRTKTNKIKSNGKFYRLTKVRKKKSMNLKKSRKSKDNNQIQQLDIKPLHPLEMNNSIDTVVNNSNLNLTLNDKNLNLLEKELQTNQDLDTKHKMIDVDDDDDEDIEMTDVNGTNGENFEDCMEYQDKNDDDVKEHNHFAGEQDIEMGSNQQIDRVKMDMNENSTEIHDNEEKNSNNLLTNPCISTLSIPVKTIITNEGRKVVDGDDIPTESSPSVLCQSSICKAKTSVGKIAAEQYPSMKSEPTNVGLNQALSKTKEFSEKSHIQYQLNETQTNLNEKLLKFSHNQANLSNTINNADNSVDQQDNNTQISTVPLSCNNSILEDGPTKYECYSLFESGLYIDISSKNQGHDAILQLKSQRDFSFFSTSTL